ncbi:MAG: thioesterase family protein [Bryobacterales bacterium]|nr:thioesterase family protein [Bryobacterales bacterium]
MLKVGISLEQVRVVRRDDCISFLGSDIRPSLATPSMIHWMEICCRDAIGPHLEPGNDSVGVKVSVSHLGATPMGHAVTYRARVAQIEGRRVTFEVEASDSVEVVGRGTHVRFAVDVKRFARRMKRKMDALDPAG